MKRIHWLIILSLMFLGSCQTTESKTNLSTESQNEVEKKELLTMDTGLSKTDEASLTVVMVPDWCTQMPTSDLSIYACGIGNSSNLNMSNSRALLDGKAKIAGQINLQVTSRMTDFLEDLGGDNNDQVRQASERIIKSVSKETEIAGYKEIKSEFQNIGDKFQTYVLLVYPIGEANQRLYNKIKEDDILSNQEAVDAALEELEAEINKKSSEN